MKLIVMTNPSFFVEEDTIITSLFDEGLECLHLYKPDSSPLLSERLLSLIPEEYYGRIIVHGHLYLKDEFALGGIHLDDEQQLPPKGYKGKVGITCRNLDDLQRMKKKYSYVILQNVLNDADTGEKSLYTPTQLAEAVHSRHIDRHVYAAGGINLSNIGTMKELGFGGVVISSNLWNKFDIQNQKDFKNVIEYFRQLKKAVG